MRVLPLVIISVGLTLASACARHDWIPDTLVTVDVNGTWQSTEGTFIRLVLEQHGPKVTGSMVTSSAVAGSSGSQPLEGRLAGDTFEFELTGAAVRWKGELTVSGDEMTGVLRAAWYGTRYNVSLRHLESPPPQQ